jgi:PilZ domain
MNMIDQLAPAVHPQPPQGRGLECRVYQRLSCELPGFCKPASDLGSGNEARWSAIVRDISQGGVRLLLSRRYQPGAGLAIELPAMDGQETCTFFAKVIHVRAEAGGLWVHGCQFVSPLSLDEMKRLTGTTVHDGFFPEDQPQALPRQSEPVEIGTTTASAPKENGRAKNTISHVQFQLVTNKGTLIDCLINRLAVSKSWPLAAGQTITIRGGSSQKSPWAIKVVVVQCSQQGERWTLQCRLPNPPGAIALLRALSTPAASPQSPH